MDNWNYLAEQGYLAYGKVTDNKNFRGEPMPLFSELPEKIRTAWAEAAKEIVKIHEQETLTKNLKLRSELMDFISN